MTDPREGTSQSAPIAGDASPAAEGAPCEELLHALAETARAAAGAGWARVSLERAGSRLEAQAGSPRNGTGAVTAMLKDAAGLAFGTISAGGWTGDGLEIAGQGAAAALERVASIASAALRPTSGDHRFRLLAESLPQLVWTCGADGRCDYLSPQWVEYTGIPAEAQFGSGWLAQVHPGDRERLSREWGAAVSGGGSLDTEFRIRRHDGVYRWFRTRAVPGMGEGGRGLKWYGSDTDVDDQRRTNERVGRYEALASELRDIILLVRRSDGRLMDCNAAACHLYGYERDELATLSIQDLRAPGALVDLEAQMAAADAGAILFETVHRRRDGSTFPVEVSTRGTVFEGVRALISVVRDITQRKQAEDALRRSQERFRRALDNIPDVVVIYNREMRIEYINQATSRLTGRPAADFVGKKDDEVLPPGVCATYLPALREAFAGNCTASVDAEVTLAGQPRRLRITCIPLADDSGEVREVVGITHDYTEAHRAEESIRSLAMFPEQNPAPVMRVSSDGTLLFANRASQPLLDAWGGRTGQPAPTILSEAIPAAMREGGIRELELELMGREFSFLLTPIADQGYVNFYGRDITARRRSERNLAAAQRRQELLAKVVTRLLASEEPRRIVEDLARMVMEAIDCDCFFNFLADERQERLRLNAYAGIDDEAAGRLELLDLGSAVCGVVARDGAPIVSENIDAGSDPRTDLVREFGIRSYACHPLKSGDRTIGTLSFGSRRKSGFTADDLALMEAVSSHIAIALERVRVAEELKRSERLYRAIARNIPDGGLWIVDRELRYVAVEGPLAERLGMGAEALEGKTIAETMPPAVRERAEARFGAALAGKAAGYEARVGDRDLWVHYVPLRDADGVVVQAMALGLDITGRKQIEEKMREAQKLESVGLLAGGVAHDFNNLLVGVMGNASLAKETLPGSHPAQPLLDRVIKTGEQAAHLTRQMLAYSGKGQFLIEPLSLSEVAAETVELVGPAISKRVTVNLARTERLPAVEADRAQIQQVITNLLINASEAIGNQEGSISVRTGCRILNPSDGVGAIPGAAIEAGEYVFVEVRDTGCGMEEQTRAKLFDPFFSTKFTGRGLGLAAVAGIMRGHKGTIEVETAPGAGSVFTAYFPASAKSAAAPRQPAAREETKRERGVVLVVDDEPVVRDLARTALTRFGYEVLLAESGIEAVATLKQHRDRVSVVLLDLSMPHMDGERTLPELRKVRHDVPVLISSGYSETEAMRIFAGQSIAGFVQKPYTAKELFARVKQAAREGPG